MTFKIILNGNAKDGMPNNDTVTIDGANLNGVSFVIVIGGYNTLVKTTLL